MAGCWLLRWNSLSLSVRLWKRELGVGAQEGEKLYMCGKMNCAGPGGETEDMRLREGRQWRLIARPGSLPIIRPNLYGWPCATLPGR